MVYPLIPLYLAAIGETHALIGVIEGIAESLSCLLKVYSGYLTDKFQKKKAIAFFGYSTGILYILALILASSWVGIFAARVIDRIGKAIRTAPRDVLVSESVSKENIGKAFGLNKASDMLGSAVGILITYFVLRSFNGNYDYKNLFAISAIPVVLGLCMFVFVKQKNTLQQTKKREPFWENIGKIDKQLKLYLLVVFIFTLGNSSIAFILLRAKSVGFDDVNVILLYFIYNIVASIFAMPFGNLSDKARRKNLLVPSYIAFALCYFGFAFADTQISMVAVFVLYGVYTAMIAGVERAFISEISPPNLKGTMFGLHSTIAGIALLPASIFAGLLWSAFGATVPFVFGASLAIIAAVILIIFLD